MTDPPPREPSLARLAARLRAALRPPSAAELERGLQVLRARVEAERGRRQWLGLAVAVASVVLCFLLGAGAVRLATKPRPPPAPAPVRVASIAGGRLLDGGYLSEVGERGVELRFDEGSAIVLAPGTRGRLRSLSPEGARFELARGAGSFTITPSAEHRWLVEAGPFVIAVKGTDFTVDWDPVAELLEVKLRRGRVTVSGPVVGGDLALRPGQDLSVSLPKGETRIVDAGARPAEAPAAVASVEPLERPAPAVSENPSGRDPPSPAPASSQGAGEPRDFGRALAAGEWDRIIADVERAGVARSLKTLSGDELFILADAARYRRRSDLARAALLAALERFPGSPRSVDALFLLGRVDELEPDGKASAIARYDRYLERAPRGAYAAPALGRKLVLLEETQGPAAARSVADEYLERFPNGSYAAAAHRIRAAR